MENAQTISLCWNRIERDILVTRFNIRMQTNAWIINYNTKLMTYHNMLRYSYENRLKEHLWQIHTKSDYYFIHFISSELKIVSTFSFESRLFQCFVRHTKSIFSIVLQKMRKHKKLLDETFNRKFWNTDFELKAFSLQIRQKTRKRKNENNKNKW